MGKQELIEKVNEVLAEEFEVEVTDIIPEGNIKETLELDSLSLVDMVALIESTFGVKIKSNEVGTILTFDSLYDFIHERLN
ncbi:acyl carrier protein [Bacteroides sp. 224]|uniref:acyl carrier protein n=1 Tax=Bacteroides sp. 224 TaxID=2302936 RepID=UPI0013D1FE44|nr:phosphopantetheine-binding protein [Bacteroides sp. 224]NDV63743.1 acyl carrier protein [Bacteroides sp. 224]